MSALPGSTGLVHALGSYRTENSIVGGCFSSIRNDEFLVQDGLVCILSGIQCVPMAARLGQRISGRLRTVIARQSGPCEYSVEILAEHRGTRVELGRIHVVWSARAMWPVFLQGAAGHSRSRRLGWVFIRLLRACPLASYAAVVRSVSRRRRGNESSRCTIGSAPLDRKGGPGEEGVAVRVLQGVCSRVRGRSPFSRSSSPVMGQVAAAA